MLEQLRRNLALLYGAEFLAKVLGLAVFGYLGRTLLQARMGDLEFALGILFLLNLVIDAGLGHYGARELAKRPGEAERLVGQVTLVRGGLVLVSLALLVVVAALLPGDRDPLASTLVVLQGLVLIPAPLVLTWVFQARDKMHVVAAASVLRQIIFALGVWLFIDAPGDAWQVPVWDAMGLGSAVLLQLVLFVRASGVVNPFRYLAGLREVIVESAPLAGSSVVWAIRLFAPLLVLWVFSTSSEAGVFGVGHRLVISAHTFVWLYFFNLLPSLSRLGMEEGLQRFQDLFSTSMRLVGWVAIGGATLGSVLAPFVIGVVYGPEFSEAALPFAVMVWVLAAGFVSGHHRFALIALSRQREEFWASVAGAAVSVVGCLALGARLNPLWAAAIFVGAETTTLVAAATLLQRAQPHLRLLEGLVRPATTTLVGVLLLRTWSPGSVFLAAGAMGAIYLAAIAVFERHGVRKLAAIKRDTDAG